MHRLVPVAAVVSVLALVASGCSRPADPPPAVALALPAETTTTTEPPPAPIAFSVTAFDVVAAGPAGAGADAVEPTKAAVLATFQTYLAEAVLGPLRSGGPAGDLRPLFIGPAADRVSTGPDRAAFVDENLPPLARVAAEDASLALTGLAGTDGRMVVVAARMRLRLTGQVEGTPLTVERSGDLTLVEHDGAWRIDGYDLRVTRDTSAGATTTTTVRG